MSEYGKLINGKLYKAPKAIRTNQSMVCNPQEEVLIGLGYKKIVLSKSLDELTPGDYYSKWHETETEIIQEIIINDLKDDPKVLYGNAYDSFKLSVAEIKITINDFEEYQKSKIDSIISKQPYLHLTYDKLCSNVEIITSKCLLSELLEKNSLSDFDGIGLTEYYQSKGYTIEKEPYCEAIRVINGEKESISPMWAIRHLLFGLIHLTEREKIEYKMVFTYLHTILDEFLMGSIKYCVTLNPLSVAGKDEIRAKDVFECEDIQSLKEKLITDRLYQLGYGDYKSKISYFQKLNINFDIDNDVLFDDVILFCEQRNVIIHNSGIVNDKTLLKLKETKHNSLYKIGDLIEPDINMCKNAINLLYKVCEVIFNAINKKF